MKFKYCDYSNTVRLMPQNHCLIVYRDGKIPYLDIDRGVDLDIATKIFQEFHSSHSFKWASGNAQADKLNKLFETGV